MRAGEILAIAGVSGNGQQELLAALWGETRLAEPHPVQICGVEAGRLDRRALQRRRRAGELALRRQSAEVHHGPRDPPGAAGAGVRPADLGGVDVGAAAFIRQRLIELRNQGCAVLVISEELDELFEISDRIAIIAKGRLAPARPIADASVEEIGV